MIANSPIAEVSPNLMVMSLEVALTHLVFFLQVQGADGWSTRGFGTPSGGLCFVDRTLFTGVSKQLDGRAPEQVGGGAATITGTSTEGIVKKYE